jgi:RNA polymerase sigma-70 factor (ECF subfamily)
METSEAPSTSPTLLGQLANRNNQQAWSTFVARYKPLIERWCLRQGLQPADADDVGGRILAKLTKSMADFEYDPAHRFRGWLKTVVNNAVRDFWRNLKNRPAALGSGDTDVQKNLEQVPSPPDVDALAQGLDETMQAEQVWDLAGRVRERVEAHTWQAYWLTAIEGRSAKEVAEQLGMTTAAVYVAKRRVGKMLRAQGVQLNRSDSEPTQEQS